MVLQPLGNYVERARVAAENKLPFLRNTRPWYTSIYKQQQPDDTPRKGRPVLLTASIAGLLLLITFLIFGRPHAAPYNYNTSIRPPPLPEPPAGDFSKASKHLVIASFSQQNVSWLDQVPSEWKVFRYIMDDPSPPAGTLPVPRNNGREAMAYLTYIIDHYDSLGDFVIFTHGHHTSWHQPEPLPWKIRALNLTALDDENYISLRCEDNMGCERVPYIDTYHPNWEGESRMREFWDHVVPGEDLPRTISYKCCAQHAVTRRSIAKRSRAAWTRMRAPLLRDQQELMAAESWARGPPEANEWILGMYFEKLWHVLLGQGGEYCPSVEVCRQRHFSNAIVCDHDMDFTMFEGEAWRGVTCRSAFEGLGRDEPANLTDWHWRMLGVIGEIRTHRAAKDGDIPPPPPP